MFEDAPLREASMRDHQPDGHFDHWILDLLTPSRPALVPTY
jgi:hypothetical protein